MYICDQLIWTNLIFTNQYFISGCNLLAMCLKPSYIAVSVKSKKIFELCTHVIKNNTTTPTVSFLQNAWNFRFAGLFQVFESHICTYC